MKHRPPRAGRTSRTGWASRYRTSVPVTVRVPVTPRPTIGISTAPVTVRQPGALIFPSGASDTRDAPRQGEDHLPAAGRHCTQEVPDDRVCLDRDAAAFVAEQHDGAPLARRSVPMRASSTFEDEDAALVARHSLRRLQTRACMVLACRHAQARRARRPQRRASAPPTLWTRDRSVVHQPGGRTCAHVEQELHDAHPAVSLPRRFGIDRFYLSDTRGSASSSC